MSRRNPDYLMITARMPRALVDRINAACELRQVTRSEFLREAALQRALRDFREAAEESVVS